MYCIYCGTQLPPGSLFCLKCGAQQPETPASKRPQPEGLAAHKLQMGISFLDNWLAFVAIGVLSTITIILFAVGLLGSAVGSLGSMVWHTTSMMQQFCLVAPLAIAAMVSTRTGGLDLSVGGMMALSSILFAMHAAAGNAGVGFLVALAVCVALGLLNGMFIMVARMPAIFVTTASAVLVRGIALWASDGLSAKLPTEWLGLNVTAALTALLVSIGIALLLLWRTGRFAREPEPMQGKMKFFWIYGLIAAIGGIAGWAAAIRLGSANAGIGAGSSNEMVLLFIFAAISASGLLKNNWAALGWVLLLALLWTVHDRAMILLELNSFSMSVSNASWVFILLAVMSIAKRSWKKPMWKISP